MADRFSERLTYLCARWDVPGSPGDARDIRDVRDVRDARGALHRHVASLAADFGGLGTDPEPVSEGAEPGGFAADGCWAAFANAPDGLMAALELQQSPGAETRTPDGHASLGIALHTGDLSDCRHLLQLAGGGQVLLSDVTAGLASQVLPAGVSLTNLGTHRLRDLYTTARMYQAHHPALVPAGGSLRSLDHLPHNLPTQLTPLVGRERELAAVLRLLGTERLVTLTGAGGIGKTRLALRSAAEGLDGFPDGAWLVELAPLAEADLLPQAVATALGVREAENRPLEETLVAYLQPRRLLLVLDNCEHLVAACARLSSALLRACSGLTILATSREPLGVPGEVQWPVPTLAVPDRPVSLHEGPAPGPETAPALDLDALLVYDAVCLFVRRAAAVEPGFRLTRENAAAVAAICQRLEGLPLALELAAARVKVLTPGQILARLDASLELLAPGARGAEPRHQTLRAAMPGATGC